MLTPFKDIFVYGFKKNVQLIWMYNWFNYERISLISFQCSSLSLPTFSHRCVCPPTVPYLIPVTLNEVPWLASVRPNSCARVSVKAQANRGSGKDGLHRSCSHGAALPGARVRSGSPFYCTACSPGYCPPHVWWTMITLEEPVGGENSFRKSLQLYVTTSRRRWRVGFGTVADTVFGWK